MAFEFTRTSTNGVPAFAFSTTNGRGVIDVHCAGLYERWDEAPWSSSSGRVPGIHYSVNSDHGEEMVVYQGFIWSLIQMHCSFALVDFASALGFQFSGLEAETWTNWFFEADENDSNVATRNQGFVRTAPLGKQLWDRRPSWYRRRAAVVPVRSVEELGDVVGGRTADSYGDVTLFGAENEAAKTRIISNLCDRTTPTLPDLLDGGSRMVHFIFGVDMGVPDSILVVGEGLDDEVDQLAQKFARAAATYEAIAASISTMDDWLNALAPE